MPTCRTLRSQRSHGSISSITRHRADVRVTCRPSLWAPSSVASGATPNAKSPHCGTGMSTADPERRKDIAWEHLSLENGWSCRICGAIPDVGMRFENNLCEDCRLSLRNYDPTAF
jgi:hypothetical protein